MIRRRRSRRSSWCCPAEIDVTNSEQVYEQLVAALAPGVATVIADMTATVFCDSSGVHAIMHAYESAAARDVRMRLAVSPATSVRRVLAADRRRPPHAGAREPRGSPGRD